MESSLQSTNRYELDAECCDLGHGSHTSSDTNTSDVCSVFACPLQVIGKVNCVNPQAAEFQTDHVVNSILRYLHGNHHLGPRSQRNDRASARLLTLKIFGDTACKPSGQVLKLWRLHLPTTLRKPCTFHGHLARGTSRVRWPETERQKACHASQSISCSALSIPVQHSLWPMLSFRSHC